MIGNCLGGPFGRRYGGYTTTETQRREPAEQPKTKKAPPKGQKPKTQRREPQQQRTREPDYGYSQEPFRNCWGTGR
jgi:hypothetical protein